MTKIKLFWEAMRSPFFAILFLATLLAQLFLPWWTAAVVPFAVAFWLAQSPAEAFGKGTLAVSLLWLFASWYSHFSSAGILTTQVANVLPLKGNSGLLIALTAVLGGLVGGLGAWSGACCKSALRS
jgi:hypothetical protein